MSKNEKNTQNSNYDYDYFVIGAGSGGVRSARIAASHGARVGIAEGRHMGGTCVNVVLKNLEAAHQEAQVWGYQFARVLSN